jgi:D-glycero-alpha-D-manno-heptose-7-phosphate kinase
LITTKTPLRVSFIGGGTDYSTFFNQSDGCIVGCTVDLNVYVTILPLPLFAREKFRFTYRKTESVDNIDDMKHPVTRELIKYLRWDTPINIATMADVPGSSGLGSSSSFTVGLTLALNRFELQANQDPKFLAETAVHIERRILKEPGGLQDQYHASFGGFRSYDFSKSGVTVGKKLLTQEQLVQLSKYFTLVSVGQGRDSTQLAEATSRASTTERFQELLALRDLSRNLSNLLHKPQSVPTIALALFDAIEEGWKIKQKFDDSIAPSKVLEAINTGKQAGAITAKLCGAGSSGFLLFGHMPEYQGQIIESFPNKYGFPAIFTDNGSKVILEPTPA